MAGKEVRAGKAFVEIVLRDRLATAVASLLSPFGLVVAAIAGGIYAWTQWSQSGKAVLATVTAAFQQIYATVQQVIGGISNALAAGDIKLAAQILWAGLKVVFYQGAQAIQTIWPLIAQGCGQAWTRIKDSAGSLMTWLAGLWAQLPAWITGPLGAVASSFGSLLGPAFSWIGQQFSQLTAWAGETFGGITDAIAAGDWGLAFEIAWASIKVAWAKGIAWITQTWSEVTTGIAMMFDSAVTAIRQIWGNVITWIASKLVQMYDGAMQILGAIAAWDPTGLAQRLHDAMAIDTQGVLRTLQQDNQQNNRGLEQGLQQRNDARGQALLDQQKAAEAELEQFRQQRRDKLDRAQTAAEAAGSVDWAAQTAAAQADLQKSLDAAAALPKLFDSNLANDTLQPAAENTSDLAMADTSKGFSSQGTFSAAAVWGLSAGGVNERAAKAAESTAANTRQLVDHARRGRLVFGYPSNAPDCQGAIGISGDSVEGVDITVPVYNFSETHYLPAASISGAYKATLFSLTGKVNGGSFKGFAAGEVLFLGASGSQRGNEDWEISFKFAASPNKTGLSVGPLTGIAKGGWQHLWVLYSSAVDQNALIKRPIAAYVEQVYWGGKWDHLVMAPFDDWRERDRSLSPVDFKAKHLAESPCVGLVESHDWIARGVQEATGKVVIAVETGRVYQPGCRVY